MSFLYQKTGRNINYRTLVLCGIFISITINGTGSEPGSPLFDALSLPLNYSGQFSHRMMKIRILVLTQTKTSLLVELSQHRGMTKNAILKILDYSKESLSIYLNIVIPVSGNGYNVNYKTLVVCGIRVFYYST